MKLSDSIKEQIRAELKMDCPVYLEGWTSPDRGIEMAELVMDVKPKVVVELGVFGGRSTIAQAIALRELGCGLIFGIDSWRIDDALEDERTPENIAWWSKIDIHSIHRGCMLALWRLRLEPRAVIVRSASQHCVEMFADGSVDILNIDGSHSEVSSCRDVNLYLPKVKNGGYVWFDDADWKSTAKAQALLEAQCDTVRVSPDGHYKLYRKR